MLLDVDRLLVVLASGEDTHLDEIVDRDFVLGSIASAYVPSPIIRHTVWCGS